MKHAEIGLIILAAGASERYGAPKQLLNYRGETLLRRIAREALASVCRPVVAVLGSKADEFKNELNDLNVHIAENPEWRDGMGGSVTAGLKKLLEIEKSVRGVVLTVCDQPFVTAEVIDKLAAAFQETGAPVVASAYRQTLGVPALFAKKLFPELEGLKGGRGGAKRIIDQFQAEAVSIPFPAGAIDIDTPGDFEMLCARNFPS